MRGNNSAVDQPKLKELGAGIRFVCLWGHHGRQLYSALNINIVMDDAYRERARIVSCTGHGWTQVKGNAGACDDIVCLVDRGEREGAEGPESVGADGGLAAVLCPRNPDAAG